MREKRWLALLSLAEVDNYPTDVVALVTDDEGPIRASFLMSWAVHWHDASLLTTIADDRTRRFPRGQQAGIAHEIGAVRPKPSEIVALNDDPILLRLG